MSRKITRALNGPSWTEVILGAIISVLLGIALSAAYLIFKPVTQVKELPKETVPGMVYYIEGSHDDMKSRRAVVKAKALSQGSTIALSEDEINSLLLTADQAAKKPAPAAGAAAAPLTAAEPTDFLSTGTPNVRIAESALQVSAPVRVKYSLFGLDTTFLVQTHGTIVRDGDTFTYHPDTICLGSCPVERLPLVSGYVMKKMLAAGRMPADLAAIWNRATDLTVEGTMLKVTTSRP